MRFVLNGVPEREVRLPIGRVMVNDSANELQRRGFDALPGRNPANGNPTAWIPAFNAVAVGKSGLTIWDDHAFLILALSALLRAKAADFIGVREARQMLARVDVAFPLLVSETVPSVVSELVFTDVLRRLASEQVSIRNMRRILMALLDWGRIESDPLYLTEYVRSGLRDQISHRLTRGSAVLVAFLLDPDLEQEIRAATHVTVTGSYIDLPPERLHTIVHAVRTAVDALGDGVQIPALITPMEIRATVQRLIQRAVPELWVTSYQELSPRLSIQPIGRIAVDDETVLRDFDVTSPWR